MKTISSSLFHRVHPPKQPTASQHPTLILLHGRGADEEDLLGLAHYFDERLLILSVRAPYSFPYSGGYTWYEFDTVGTADPAMFKSSYDKLSTFIADVLEQYPIDRKHVYLLGFSMGTMMSYSLALTQPRLFRGVIANSGYIPEDTHLTFLWKGIGHIDFFVAHGTLDPVIPVQFGRRSKELLEGSGARLSYKEYPMTHQISDESLNDMALWMTHNLNNQ